MQLLRPSQEGGSPLGARAARLSLAMIALLALSGCSANASVGTGAASSGGALELGVSETCAEDGAAQCVSVNGQKVVDPARFERAEIETVTVVEGTGQAIDVLFTADGAATLSMLTEQAANAGGAARLVFKIGDEFVAVVAVPQALESDQVQIVLAPDASASELAARLREG